MAESDNVSYFIQKGANPLVKDVFGFTPLDLLRKSKTEWKILNSQYIPSESEYNLCEELLNNAIDKTKKNNS